MATEPTSLIDGSMPSAGEPIEGMEEEEIIVEELEEDPDVTEQEDGSVVIGPDLEDELQQQMLMEPDANLAELLEDDELSEIASDLISNYEEDRSGRQEWEDAYTEGLELLGIKYEDREEPFRGSSGVTHPLIAEAVTQFQAQAYKELLPSSGPVRTQVVGTSTPEVVSQSQRIQDFMNYQIIHVMDEYDPEMDRLLFYLPLAGSAFKKVYFDDILDRAVSRFVPADDLVVPYNATDIASASRVTHVTRMSLNDVRKFQAGGFYRDIELEPYEQEDEVRDKERELSGVEKTSSDLDCTILEVHTDLDLPGFEHVSPIDGEKTGIKIPYIVTIDSNNNNILSIYRNYAENDPLRQKIEYFVHFKFLPGLGFYGFGLTHMIGGLSKASTSILRQLIDAGTLANLPAGFKTRGIRIRDEDTPIQPGEFRDVDAPGGSLRESIQPLPFKEPSGTLLSLLNILVTSGQRFASIAEINVGQGNPNAPVGTTLALLERSTKVLSAIHKRLHNSQRKEFQILANVFQEYLPPEYPYAIAGGNNQVKLSDFDERVDIFPVSNPDIFSQSQRIAMAQEMMQLVQSNPEVHGPTGIYESYKRMYAAIGVDNIDQILTPPPSGEPQPVEAGFENNQLLLGNVAKAFPNQNHDAHIATHMSLLNTPPVQMNAQVQALIHSHIMEHLQMKADVLAQQQMPAEVLQQFQQLQAQAEQVSPAQQQQLVVEANNILAQYSAPIMSELIAEYTAKISAPEDEDPLVAIRKQELALKGQELALDQQQFIAQEQRKAEDSARRAQIDRERINASEDIAEMRDDTARARLDQQRLFKNIDLQNRQ